MMPCLKALRMYPRITFVSRRGGYSRCVYCSTVLVGALCASFHYPRAQKNVLLQSVCFSCNVNVVADDMSVSCFIHIFLTRTRVVASTFVLTCLRFYPLAPKTRNRSEWRDGTLASRHILSVRTLMQIPVFVLEHCLHKQTAMPRSFKQYQQPFSLTIMLLQCEPLSARFPWR